MKTKNSLDVVVPVYNEGKCLKAFYSSLESQLRGLQNPYRIIFVNDGSLDDTQAELEELAKTDPQVCVIELSRNFGHQAAISCGMNESDADFVITIDGDGEHPVEKIPEMVALAEQGFDIVFTQREEAQSAPWFKRVTSDFFYKIIRLSTTTPILEGVGDFRLMTRAVIDVLNSMPEYHRFLRGMVAWMGFHSAVVSYVPAKRLGGKTKYTVKKMIKLAQDAIFSFSLAPIIIGLVIGLVFLCVSIILGVISLFHPFFGSPASSLIIFFILFCSGVIISLFSLIGFYSGLTFQQVKWRPNYIVRSKTSSNK